MRKLTNTLSLSPKGFQGPKFSDSDFRLPRTRTSEKLWCSSTTSSAQLTACLRDPARNVKTDQRATVNVEKYGLSNLARHFKTDLTETVTLCFGYPKTPCFRAN
jgi:hypothetical protein